MHKSNYEIFIENKEYLGQDFQEIISRNDPKEIVKLGQSLMKALANQLGMKQDGLIVYNNSLMISFGLHLFDFSKMKILGSEKEIVDYKYPRQKTYLTMKLDSDYYYMPVEIFDIKTKEFKGEVESVWKKITSPVNDNFEVGKSSYKLLMESIIVEFKSDYDLSRHENLIELSKTNQELYKKEFKNKYSN